MSVNALILNQLSEAAESTGWDCSVNERTGTIQMENGAHHFAICYTEDVTPTELMDDIVNSIEAEIAIVDEYDYDSCEYEYGEDDGGSQWDLRNSLLESLNRLCECVCDTFDAIQVEEENALDDVIGRIEASLSDSSEHQESRSKPTTSLSM